MLKTDNHTLRFALFSLLVSSALLICGCDDKSQVKESAPVVTKVSGKTMGTFYSITVPGGFAGGEAALKELAEGEFKKIIDVISPFDDESEISKFNAFESTKPYPVSQYLADIVEECIHQSRRIDGAMDISVGPLVNLWGFGRKKTDGKIPSQEEIDAAREYVGLDKFEVRNTQNGSMLIKHDERVKIDLATVGEGLGADAVAAALDRLGVKNYMVAVAGASRSRGLNAKGELWKVGIEDPSRQEHSVFQVVCPLDQAMSTAGSYRNFFKDDASGKVFSHAIDPVTGRPVEHSTLSVTVIDRSTFVTDALDTGLLVMGADKALEWGNKHDIALYTIEYRDGKTVGRHTKAFEQYLKCASKK